MSQEFETQNITEEDERLSFGFLNDLQDFMDSEEVQELNIDTEGQHFKITSREQAGFFIRKVQEVREEAEQINAAAKKELDRLAAKITTWQEKEIARCANAESYIMSLLENFAEEELAGSDKRSLKLPFGTLGFRKQQDKYEYDDKTLLEFLEENKLETYIQRKPSPKKADLKKVGMVKDGSLYVDGVLIKGITITPQEDKFEIK